MMRSILLIIIAFASQSSFADCLSDAAAYHHLSPALVHAIAQHESGMRANAVNQNTDGSEDIGLMQINSSWLPTLARYGIDRPRLFNACVNAYVGSWILESNIKQFGMSWRAVGAYNARSPEKQLIYARAIYRRLERDGNY
jgi:soluble lytic murein transglycosylase-like protein